MTTVTGYTAAKMQEIENETVIGGEVDGSGHLILETRGAAVADIDAGSVIGPQGDIGPSGDVPKFANTAARDTALPTPVNGQMCTVAEVPQVYRSGSNARWLSLTGVLCLVKLNSAPLLVADGTLVTCPFDTYPINIGSYFNTTTKLWTAPYQGIVEVNISVILTIASPGTNGSVFVSIVKGSTEEMRVGQIVGPATMAFTATGGGAIEVAAGETISAAGWISAPGILKSFTGPSSMSIRYIG